MEHKAYILSFSSDCNCGTAHSIQAFETEEEALTALKDIFIDSLDCQHLTLDDIEFDEDGYCDTTINGNLIMASDDKFYINWREYDDYYIAHGVVEYADIYRNNILCIV